MAPSPAPHSPALAAVVVAAGQGLRAGQPLPKQFALWRGKPVLRHAVEALVKAGVGPIVVVIPTGAEDLTAEILQGLPHVSFVCGGATRQASVLKGLEALSHAAPEVVLIHDAARPDCPEAVVKRLVVALEHAPGAIPVLPVVDSLVYAAEGRMGGSARREELRRVQTPQAFHFAAILAAHRAWQGRPDAGDDAQVARAAGLEIALITGDERLRKLTFAEDFMDSTSTPPPRYPRTGTGFDVHRLAAGEELWLCGIQLAHDRGLAGHSDADVALHALVDAVLGAVGAGDIGQHFPPSDPQWKGAASSRFVSHAVELARAAGYEIGNVDLTIICEAPRIGPHRDAMRQRLAELLGTAVDAVNVKGTTSERLGFAGRGEGIAAQAVATLIPLERM
ncbi:bifunctional enzyme IspD/IspF [Altererythrobacter sp. B11]|uniref:bifunctional 2-C-methyl-D-erythritol 4-phosphate cytidylyltransferase/2-C-methyl-D-erythritol 2,4-cyclodiphosphate synthase n=1 Tax=Altererythrobacter sp. B11 TaxID=2060312 RepID=UPI000DC726FC|nr:bifunctional 2-C-methyl-D-erythritol 4-phosphate cytidylyltransferase/2-C-methyl-D-erythritol 2,4-cyclodiphosphate synthase [Altererythrobacter sp. B11]BBC73145.1 bifunctional enzyme IspD/IspF [Altererythrobacter sp. B11]